MSSYCAWMGLEYDPFIKQSKHGFRFDSEQFKDVFSRLEFHRSIGGFALLTGAAGLGKTTTLREWTKTLNPNRYKICYINLTTLSAPEFYRELACQLDLEPKYRKQENYRQIQEEISRLAIERKITPVIIIDEVNQLSGSVLTDLKMIFNFEMDSQERAIVILCGLPHFKTVLRQPGHEPLRQRIMMNCAMEPMEQKEAREYIRAKLEAAGGSQSLFEEKALNVVTAGAKGVPRLIDKMCNRCLILAEAERSTVVTQEIATLAAHDIEL